MVSKDFLFQKKCFTNPFPIFPFNIFFTGSSNCFIISNLQCIAGMSLTKMIAISTCSWQHKSSTSHLTAITEPFVYKKSYIKYSYMPNIMFAIWSDLKCWKSLSLTIHTNKHIYAFMCIYTHISVHTKKISGRPYYAVSMWSLIVCAYGV